MKKLLILLGFSLILTSCKKEVIEPINKSLNVIDSLSITGFVSKDLLVHNFNVQYLINITIDTLVIEDNFGNAQTLFQIYNNQFSSSNFLGVEGRLYTLKLMYNGNVYQDIDSLEFTNSSNNFLPKAILEIKF